jgi:hypothetical protein
MEFIEEEATLIDISRVKEKINGDQINEVVHHDYGLDDLDYYESEDFVMFGVGGPG